MDLRGNVSLAAAGLPDGVSATFSPNPTGTGSSVLTLTAGISAPLGTKTVTITGTSGSETAATVLVATVGTEPTATSTTLQIASAGQPVTSVASGTVVTLSAAVSGGVHHAHRTGELLRCDSELLRCTASGGKRAVDERGNGYPSVYPGNGKPQL